MKSLAFFLLGLSLMLGATIVIGQDTAPASKQVSPSQSSSDLKTQALAKELADVRTQLEEQKKAASDQRKTTDEAIESLQSSITDLKGQQDSWVSPANTIAWIAIGLTAVSLVIGVWTALRQPPSPQATGVARIRWKKGANAHDLPRPDFTLELTNKFAQDVRVKEVIFHLPHGHTERISFSKDEELIAAGSSKDVVIPKLDILKVSRVELVSGPGKVSKIPWNRQSIQRAAAFKHLGVKFFTREFEGQHYAALNLFSAGDELYVSLRCSGYVTPDQLECFKARTSARAHFDDQAKWLTDRDWTQISESECVGVSDARTEFLKYWEWQPSRARDS